MVAIIHDYDSNLFIPYDAAEHLIQAFKFLYWEPSAEQGQEAVLVLSHAFDQMAHDDLLELAKAANLPIPTRLPDGAGNISLGTMSTWSSLMLKIQTPNRLKAEIQTALGITE